MKSIIISLVIVSLFLGGCASQAPQREGARILAAHSTTVQQELTAFAARRTEIDKQRQRNAKRLLASGLEAEDFDARTIAAWSAERKKFYEEVLASAAASAERDRRAAAALKERDAVIAATTSLVATRKDQLSAAAKALSRLAQPDKLVDLLKFYRDFAGEVQDAVKEAAKEQKESEAAAAKAATELSTPKTNDGGPK